MEYPKQTLTERRAVFSDSLQKEEQSYKIEYLEKVNKYNDKIRIYFYDRPKGECTPRSISFFNPQQLLMFIKECTKAYLYLQEKRIAPEMTSKIANYRMEIMLPDMLSDIREEQVRHWKNGGGK